MALSDTQLGSDLSSPGLSLMPEIKKRDRGKAGDQMELDSPSVAAPSFSIVRKGMHTIEDVVYGTLDSFTPGLPFRSCSHKPTVLYHAIELPSQTAATISSH